MLDSGEAVSLIGAQNHGGPGYGSSGMPRYEPWAVVVGAHVESSARYASVRFRIDDHMWLAHLTEGESATVPDDGASLSVVAESDGAWLVYETPRPLPLRVLKARVVLGCLLFARLITGVELDVRETEVRLASDDKWLRVYAHGFNADDLHADESMLPTEQLTIQRFANWIASMTPWTSSAGLLSKACAGQHRRRCSCTCHWWKGCTEGCIQPPRADSPRPRATASTRSSRRRVAQHEKRPDSETSIPCGWHSRG